MLKTLKRIVFLTLGSLLVICGAFIAIAGVLGGLGASSIGLKIVYAIVGALIFLFGTYLYYQGRNKSILKVIGDIIDAIIFNI